MSFARKALLVLITPLLPVLLFATAADFGVLKVAGSPAPVKKLLVGSGVYKSVVTSALDQAQKSSDNGDDGIPLNDPAIKQAAQESFSPQVVQQSSENVIDGIYNWLSGKSAQPDFNVNLTSQKNTFAQKVGQIATERAAKLPPCTAVPASTDPFSINCLPRGLTPEQAGQQASQSVLTAQGFLEHPVITASSFKGQGTNQSVFVQQNVKKIPVQYQRAKKTPYILIFLTLVTVVAIIFLNTSRRKGIRHVGITLITTGLFMLVFAWAINSALTRNVVPKIQLDNKVLQADVQKLAGEIVHSVSHNYALFGGVYSLVGILAMLGAIFIGRNKLKPAAGVPDAGQPKPASAPPQKRPVQKQPPPKNPRKMIQG
jgi:hypothetical protein